MKIFSQDGIIYKLITNFIALMKINLLWLLFSLPIVTLGGATIAAYDVFLKMADEEEGYIGRQFVESFKKNFKTGIPYGLLLLLCIYVVWLDFSLFEQIEDNPIILLIMGMISAFVFLISLLFAFPLQARYENTLIKTLKNSADISIKFFVRTLTLIIALAVEAVFFLWNSTTAFFGVLIGPACLMYTVAGYARIFFREIEKEPGSVVYPEEESNEKGEKT